LREGLGELAIKKTAIAVQSNSPKDQANDFRKFAENINFESTVQTLIAVA